MVYDDDEKPDDDLETGQGVFQVKYGCLVFEPDDPDFYPVQLTREETAELEEYLSRRV